MSRALPRTTRRLLALLAAVFVASATLVASAPAAAVTGISGALTIELQESVDPAHKIAAKQVELWISGDTVPLEAGLTALDGTYTFDTELDGLVSYEVLVDSAGDQDGTYQPIGPDDKTDVTSTSMTISLVPSAGTVSGTISNWNPSLIDDLDVGDGTFVSLWRNDPVYGWDWVADGDNIYGDWFRIAGVYDSEDYLVTIQTSYASDFYPTASDGSAFSSLIGPDANAGVTGVPSGNVSVGAVTLVVAAVISGRVTARDGTFPQSFLLVIDDAGLLATPAIVEFAVTESDGTWSAKVAPGYDYVVLAQDTYGDYYSLVWNDRLGGFGCLCGIEYDPINVVGGATTSGIDFELTPVDTSVMFELYLSEIDQANQPAERDLEGVTVHLYRPVTGGWQEVDTHNSGAFGFAYVAGATEGTYRMRFSSGSDWLPFTRYTDDVGTDHAVTASCYLDVTGTTLGDDLYYDFLIDTEATTPACGPEPAISSGSGNTPSGTTTASSGHTRARAATAPVFELPAVLPTPSPTPTATTTPAPADEATPSATPKPDTVPASADLGWLLWLLIVLAVLVLGSVAFFVFRRR